jgi:hypothetical protein
MCSRSVVSVNNPNEQRGSKIGAKMAADGITHYCGRQGL